jgi:hypothetical protein
MRSETDGGARMKALAQSLSRRGIARGVVCAASCCLLSAHAGRAWATLPDFAERDPQGRYTLSFRGSQRETLAQGRTEGRINLGSIASLRRCCAVGPAAGLDGEITVDDGTGLVSRVRHGAIITERTFDAEAPFLVWAEVAAWRTITIPVDLASLDRLSELLPDMARANGLDPDRALPFRLEGVATLIEFHVLRPSAPGGSGGQAHSENAVSRRLASQPVHLVGFHSRHHHGVFVHHGINIHVHVSRVGEDISGHVDHLTMASGAQLFLPAPA